ncbi:hypothetical protein [Chitinophaga japonensis]|uniref:Uncharacterized protein n=1 Tax=Chitinophaga japonensis TaxID=104662 RepID=A0A562SMB3_CHIJA|nr:hypothetical protein [Chitinophaga japonensis]TWI82459.1 hypothetical protein LX66_5032 [Chitinophaga japonensis]
MYYLGSPFEQISQVDEATALKRSGYYKEKEMKVPFADKIIEAYHHGNIDLVIYVKARHGNKALIDFHNEHYGQGMSFHVEDYVAERTIHTTRFINSRISGFSVYHFDEYWRLKIDQAYDEKYGLIEYRELYYHDEEELPFEEQFFFASNWIIRKEKYK